MALPNMIRSDNGNEFCGKTMVTWPHERDVQLHLIEPGKPNQNVCILNAFARSKNPP